MLIDDRYELDSRIAEGPIGDRFRATDRLASAGAGTVELTILATDLARDRSQLDNLRRRFRDLQRLDHPAVPRYFDCGESRGVTFTVTEYVDGESLADIVRQLEPESLEATEIDSIVATVGEALVHAHRTGISHGTLSMSSILVTQECDIRVTGFEVAALTDRADVDSGADVLALARILYELRTGLPPLAPPDRAALSSLPRGEARALVAALDGSWCPPMPRFLARLGLEHALVIRSAPTTRSALITPTVRSAAPAPRRRLAGTAPLAVAAGVAVAMAAVIVGKSPLLAPFVERTDVATPAAERQSATASLAMPVPRTQADAPSSTAANTAPVTRPGRPGHSTSEALAASARADPGRLDAEPTAPSAALDDKANALPQFSLGATTLSVGESATVARLPVTAHGDLPSTEVIWWTADGTAKNRDDYGGLGRRSETIARGKTAYIVVPIVSDAVAESDEYFEIYVTAVLDGSQVGELERVTVRITDDD